MGGGQDVDLNDEPMPPWALRRASGNYLERDAVLPTRDGRFCGNATVFSCTHAEISPGVGTMVAFVVTDAGNMMRLTITELEQVFYSPQWVRKPRELLELGINALLAPDEISRPSEMLKAEMSAAISLKRIADVLEGNGVDRASLADTIFNAITSACSGIGK